jgi:hypothetical protein
MSEEKKKSGVWRMIGVFLLILLLIAIGLTIWWFVMKVNYQYTPQINQTNVYNNLTVEETTIIEADKMDWGETFVWSLLIIALFGSGTAITLQILKHKNKKPKGYSFEICKKKAIELLRVEGYFVWPKVRDWFLYYGGNEASNKTYIFGFLPARYGPRLEKTKYVPSYLFITCAIDAMNLESLFIMLGKSPSEVRKFLNDQYKGRKAMQNHPTEILQESIFGNVAADQKKVNINYDMESN